MKLIDFLTTQSGEARLIYAPTEKQLIISISEEEFIFERLSPEFIGKVLNGLTQQTLNLKESIDIPVKEINQEVIFYGFKVFISGSFIERVKTEAGKRGLQTDYIIHHHPVSFLLRLLTQDKPKQDRIEVYQKSLAHTESDIEVSKKINVKVLEVRGLGKVEDIMNDKVFTSNFVIIPEN